jgi:UDP-3-O-[3-hydroxymyristoyl] glucosamine N-acyltransferase
LVGDNVLVGALVAVGTLVRVGAGVAVGAAVAVGEKLLSLGATEGGVVEAVVVDVGVCVGGMVS